MRYFKILIYGALGFSIASFIALFLYETLTSNAKLNEFAQIIGLALVMAMNCGLSFIIIIVPSLFLRALPAPFNILKYIPTFAGLGAVWFAIIQAQIGAIEFWLFANLAIIACILYFVMFLRWADKALSLPD